MNAERELTDLYSELGDAKAAHDDALMALGSCRINTPGRCKSEERAVKDAEARVSRLRARIRDVENALRRYDGVRR